MFLSDLWLGKWVKTDCGTARTGVNRYSEYIITDYFLNVPYQTRIVTNEPGYRYFGFGLRSLVAKLRQQCFVVQYMITKYKIDKAFSTQSLLSLFLPKPQNYRLTKVWLQKKLPNSNVHVKTVFNLYTSDLLEIS